MKKLIIDAKVSVNGKKSIVGMDNPVEIYTKTGVDEQIKNIPIVETAYKVFTALVTQIGTNDPDLVILENTIDPTLTFTRNVAGMYLSNMNIDNTKATYNINAQHSGTDRSSIGYNTTFNRVMLETRNNSGLVDISTMSLSSPISIEIRLYN
mgnify:CR=1 FL=1